MAMTMGTLGEMVMRRYTLTGGKRIGRPKVMQVRKGAAKTKPVDITKIRQRMDKAIHTFQQQARTEVKKVPTRPAGNLPNIEAFRSYTQALVKSFQKAK